MSKNFPRFIPVALAATLILGACGGDDEIGEPISTVTDQPSGTDPSGAMRSPEPINVVGGASGNAAASADASASAEIALDDRMMIAPFTYEYVIGDGLGALPTADTGYVFDVATEVTAAEVTALAASFGVTGEAVRIDEGYGVSWRVGPDDGSGPVVYVYDDAQLSWNYSGPWDVGSARSGCATVGVEPIDPAIEEPPVEGVDVDSATSDIAIAPPDTTLVEPDFVCEEPAPPTGILTADEAQQRATEILAGMGVDVSSLTWDSYGDEWFASANARGSVGGAIDIINYDFGFGAEGALQYAGGSLATPEPVGPYTLVDLDTAVARLDEMNFGYGVGRGGDIAIDMPAIEPMPADMPESGEPAVEPEVMTVTLVSVEADYWWVWDAEGSAWLLPAYRFIDSDGGWHTVPAVTDDYLIQVEPPVEDTPLPLPVEVPPTVVPETIAPEPVPVDPPETTTVPTAPTEPTEPTTEPSVPAEKVVEVEDIVRDVSYYPACMNEPVEINGAIWYPIADWGNDEQAALVKEIVAIPRAEPVSPNGFAPQVAEPGPGDDTGTLYIYADGIAWYLTDSGNGVWMTTDEMTYDWVC